MFVPLRYMYLRNFPFFSVNNIFPAGGSLALPLLGTAEVEGRRKREDREKVKTAKREGGGASRRTCAGHKRARSTRHKGDARHHRAHHHRYHQEDREQQEANTAQVLSSVMQGMRKFYRASRKG